MTDDIEALTQFTVVDKPQHICFETPYVKLAKAASLLANDKAICLPQTYFKTKNFAPSISSAAKRIGIKVRILKQQGNVYIFKR